MTTPTTPTIRAYPQANSLVSTDAFIIDRIGTGTMYVEASVVEGGGSSLTYVAAFDFLGGTPPGASEIMGIHFFTETVTFGANFSGAGGFINSAPSGELDVDIASAANGSVGTMIIAVDGSYSFNSSDLPVTFAAGDAVIFTAPSDTDATAADFGWTIQGSIG